MGGQVDPPQVVDMFPPHVQQDLAYLLLALLFFLYSLFMLYESFVIQGKVSAIDVNAPRPFIGVLLGASSSIGVLALWFWLALSPTRAASDGPLDWLVALPTALITQPIRYMSAFLVAGVLPAAISLYYFFVATFHRFPSPDAHGTARQRSPVSAIIGAVITFISLVASIVTLIGFYEMHR